MPNYLFVGNSGSRRPFGISWFGQEMNTKVTLKETGCDRVLH